MAGLQEGEVIARQVRQDLGQLRQDANVDQHPLACQRLLAAVLNSIIDQFAPSEAHDFRPCGTGAQRRRRGGMNRGPCGKLQAQNSGCFVVVVHVCIEDEFLFVAFHVADCAAHVGGGIDRTNSCPALLQSAGVSLRPRVVPMSAAPAIVRVQTDTAA